MDEEEPVIFFDQFTGEVREEELEPGHWVVDVFGDIKTGGGS